MLSLGKLGSEGSDDNTIQKVALFYKSCEIIHSTTKKRGFLIVCMEPCKMTIQPKNIPIFTTSQFQMFFNGPSPF